MIRLRVQTMARLLRNSPGSIPSVLRDHRTLARIGGEDQRAGAGEHPVVRLRTIGRVELMSTHDTSELREIVVSNMYCANDFVPRSGWTVVDLGANLGFFSMWTLAHMTAGSLIAIEPVRETFEVMGSNLRGLSGGVATRLVNMAASSGARTVWLWVPRGPSGWSSAAGGSCSIDCVCAPWLRALGEVTLVAVRAETLDCILAQALGEAADIDLLKVDVEGMEVDCLGGADKALRRIRRVVFEYHGPELRAACSVLLARQGFSEVLRRAPYAADIGLSFWKRTGA